MFIYTILVLLCILSGLRSAEEDTLQVTIFYYSKNTKTFLSVSIREMHADPKVLSSLCHTLYEKTLAPRILRPEVDYYSGGPQLLDPSVYRLVSHKAPFQSKDIDEAFIRIESILRNTPQKNTSNTLKANDIIKHIYPRGKTRTWSVQPRTSGLQPCDDHVFITFNKGKDLLQGVVSTRRLPSQGTSLLQAKTFFASYQPPLAEPPKRAKSLSIFTKRNVPCMGLLYFDGRSNTPYGAIFNVHALQTDDIHLERTKTGEIMEATHSTDLGSRIQNEMLRGYIAKHFLRYHFDHSDCEHPEVRDAVCDRAPFLSQPLRFHIQNTFAALLNKSEEEHTNGWLHIRGWENLQAQHLQNLYSKTQTLEWHLVDKNATLRSVEHTPPKGGSVLITMTWDHVALKGVPTPTTKDTLDLESHPPLHSLAYYRSITAIDHN